MDGWELMDGEALGSDEMDGRRLIDGTGEGCDEMEGRNDGRELIDGMEDGCDADMEGRSVEGLVGNIVPSNVGLGNDDVDVGKLVPSLAGDLLGISVGSAQISTLTS